MLRIMVGLARGLHVVSAFWVLLIAFMIVGDVVGRALLSRPIQGTSEIIKNSVVAISFMQLPLAIFSGAMLRTEIFADGRGPLVRRLLRTVGYALGCTLFLLVALSAWPDAVVAWRIGEYEGEGALRVPTWPVRWLMIGTAIYTAAAYVSMIWLDWTGGLDRELAYPGTMDDEPADLTGEGR